MNFHIFHIRNTIRKSFYQTVGASVRKSSPRSTKKILTLTPSAVNRLKELYSSSQNTQILRVNCFSYA